MYGIMVPPQIQERIIAGEMTEEEWRDYWKRCSFVTGGYDVPPAYLRQLLRIKSMWDRRARKKRRRYEHQKRKQ
jgi:hypothetical protein